MIQTIALASLISVLFPATCVLCGAPGVGGRDLCAGCDAELPRNRASCFRCALPLEGSVPPGMLCGRCQKKAPPFERCITVFRYESAVPSLVVGAKFRGRLNFARLLGQCLAETIREHALALPDVLVPVPLHSGRLRERGYNQALEIARALGRELDLPVDAKCCIRIAATQPQVGLDPRARRRNLRGAFALTRQPPWRRVAIVDDVVTTGSTVAELSRDFLKAGVEQVDVWAVARTS
ncbi:ComF family protein [Thiocystis violascens]|uniref:Putative amidophosphoribosyltransferase n=1 Tax=Thiocystis violascens (strain ATCC 17096 / DSM 198 / 6111) TaxID=765911 RepID=I3Y9R7_THIV6|nr:ComF family protein [Thiocystis violascens]AFL73735.1 putative amidophosphoribosyltransferase [Thiocystis violascens DSM 198]